MRSLIAASTLLFPLFGPLQLSRAKAIIYLQLSGTLDSVYRLKVYLCRLKACMVQHLLNCQNVGTGPICGRSSRVSETVDTDTPSGDPNLSQPCTDHLSHPRDRQPLCFVLRNDQKKRTGAVVQTPRRLAYGQLLFYGLKGRDWQHHKTILAHVALPPVSCDDLPPSL